MILVSGNTRYMQIFAGRTTVRLSTTAISSVFDDYFFGKFTNKALVSFSVIPKCLTLNGPEELFHVKFGLVFGVIYSGIAQ